MSTLKTQSLKGRAMRASIWTLGLHIVSQVMRLGSNLIITRLLAPEMFGLMAIANMIVFGVGLISDIGLNQNLIQSKRGGDVEFVNTVWTISVFRGLFIFVLGILMGIAVYWAGKYNLFSNSTVYAEPMLPLIVATISLNALISGFTSTKVATSQRDLNLAKVTIINLCSQPIGIVIMLLWAWYSPTVWSLVFGSMVSSIVNVWAGHYFISGQTNKFHWDKNSIYEIVHFGKWVFLTSTLGFLSMSGDRLILGGLVDSGTLGIYATAFFLMSAVQEVLSKIIASVVFPSLSEVVRDKPARLKAIYYKFRILFDVTILLMAGILFSCGHIAVDILYDGRYKSAGHMLEVLSLSLLDIRYGITQQLCMAIGKPKMLVPLILLKMIPLFLFMPYVFNIHGMDGVIWLISLSGLMGMPLVLFYQIKLNVFDWKNELMVLPLLPVGYYIGNAILSVYLMYFSK